MKTLSLLRTSVAIMASGFALLLAGNAVAAIGTQAYTIVIKDGVNNAIISSAPSGLSFTDSQTKSNGNYPPEISPAPVVTVTKGSGIRPSNFPLVFKNVDPSFNVRVSSSSLNGQDQGQNVAGLVGRLTTDVKRVSGRNVSFAIDFAVSGPSVTGEFTRGYTISQINANSSETVLSRGAHHVVNPASIPEPGSLMLIAVGILGLGFAVSRRKNSLVKC